MITEFTWKDSLGINIQAVEWKPETPAKAVLTIVHGLGEHYRRYQHLADFLNQAGFIVQSFDLPGHGKSSGKRGHMNSYDEASENINHLNKRSSDLYPDLPRFLYGHSLGGALVTYTTLYHQPDVRLVIASAPGMSPAAPVSAGKLFLARWMDMLFPSFTLNNDLDTSGLSHDPQVEKEYLADPLVHPYISARLGMQLLANGAKMLQVTEFPVPYIVMQGSEDRLVNPIMNIEWGEHLQGDAALKVYQGFFHELHNEPQKLDVYNFLLSSMLQRL